MAMIHSLFERGEYYAWCDWVRFVCWGLFFSQQATFTKLIFGQIRQFKNRNFKNIRSDRKERVPSDHLITFQVHNSVAFMAISKVPLEYNSRPIGGQNRVFVSLGFQKSTFQSSDRAEILAASFLAPQIYPKMEKPAKNPLFNFSI